MALLRVNYCRKRAFGITSPFYHTYFEIHQNGKLIKRGYNAISYLIWPISLILPIPGRVTEDFEKVVRSVIVSRDGNKIKKVLKLVGSKKYDWEVYSAPFRNCFHWRNSILEEAGIKHPTGDWF